MKNIHSFLALFCTCTVFMQVSASAQTPLLIDFPQRFDIDAVVQSTLALNNVPGASVGVIVDGLVVWNKGYGFRNVAMKLPVTDTTLFAIGSCTKAFTSALLAILVDQGALAWDDPVIKYLPEFCVKDPFITPRLTLRDLACHRSGMPRHELVWIHSDATRQELIRAIRHLDFSCDLREKFQYNNLMYMVLGAVIEQVTHMSWEEAVMTYLFKPLHMTKSTISLDEVQKNENYSLPYMTVDNKLVSIPFHPMRAVGPAGAIYSCSSDMLAWVNLQLSQGTVFDTHILKPETLKELHTQQMSISEYPEKTIYNLGYALGWVTGMYKGLYCVWHNGSIDGFQAYIALLPQKRIGVVVLTNSSDDTNAVGPTVAHAIFDAYAQLPQENKEALSVRLLSDSVHTETEMSKALLSEPGTYDEYVGIYEHPGYGQVTVRSDEGKLIADYTNFSLCLSSKARDLFAGHPSVVDLSSKTFQCAFMRNLFGEVDRVRIPFEPAVSSIIFSKRVSAALSKKEYLRKFIGNFSGDEGAVETYERDGFLWANFQGKPCRLISLTSNSFVFENKETYRLEFIVNEQGTVLFANLTIQDGMFCLRKQ